MAALSDEQKSKLRDKILKAQEDEIEYIHLRELRDALLAVGLNIPGCDVRMLEEQFKKDNSKKEKISLHEFETMYSKLKCQKEENPFRNALKPMNQDVKIIINEDSNRIKFIKDSEKEAFAKWINSNLAKDNDLKLAMSPIQQQGNDLFVRCGDGLVLCKLINFAVPNTIDDRCVNKGKKLHIYEELENVELALRSAEAIGCHVINIRPNDIRDGREHLILSLLWQIIKIGLFAEISLTHHPDMICLLNSDESKEDLFKMQKEELLLRWMNFNLKKSGYTGREIKNFSEDIKNSVAYLYLLRAISTNISLDAIKEKDLLVRAELMLKETEKINCREFLTPEDVVSGHNKLNMAFVANLFNKYPNLVSDQKIVVEEGLKETREEKTFRNWINSMGVKPNVNYLYTDLRDCSIIFQIYEIIKPGCVDFKRVISEFDPKKVLFEKLSNCNYAIQLGTSEMKFVLVGIQGSNILEGHKIFTLALLWQLMRAYILSLLERGHGTIIDENTIINWVNEKDKNISDARVVCDLIDAIKPASINYSLLKNGNNKEAKFENAMYAISIARKIGARIFALPEDIVEVKQKMVMTIFATLMILDLQTKQ